MKIYLENLPLALQMQKAGFDKKCVHYAAPYSDIYTPFGASIYYNGVHLADVQDVEIDKKVYLPTLGEIELPPYLSIRLDYDNTFFISSTITDYSYFIGVYLEKLGLKNEFQTELQARCYAWLWAKQYN